MPLTADCCRDWVSGQVYDFVVVLLFMVAAIVMVIVHGCSSWLVFKVVRDSARLCVFVVLTGAASAAERPDQAGCEPEPHRLLELLLHASDRRQR